MFFSKAAVASLLLLPAPFAMANISSLRAGVPSPDQEVNESGRHLEIAPFSWGVIKAELGADHRYGSGSRINADGSRVIIPNPRASPPTLQVYDVSYNPPAAPTYTPVGSPLTGISRIGESSYGGTEMSADGNRIVITGHGYVGFKIFHLESGDWVEKLDFNTNPINTISPEGVSGQMYPNSQYGFGGGGAEVTMSQDGKRVFAGHKSHFVYAWHYDESTDSWNRVDDFQMAGPGDRCGNNGDWYYPGQSKTVSLAPTPDNPYPLTGYPVETPNWTQWCGPVTWYGQKVSASADGNRVLVIAYDSGMTRAGSAFIYDYDSTNGYVLKDWFIGDHQWYIGRQNDMTPDGTRIVMSTGSGGAWNRGLVVFDLDEANADCNGGNTIIDTTANPTFKCGGGRWKFNSFLGLSGTQSMVQYTDRTVNISGDGKRVAWSNNASSGPRIITFDYDEPNQSWVEHTLFAPNNAMIADADNGVAGKSIYGAPDTMQMSLDGKYIITHFGTNEGNPGRYLSVILENGSGGTGYDYSSDSGSDNDDDESGGDESGGDTPGASGDPHIKMWTGDVFDFMGECDVVLAKSLTYGAGAGLELQIRTTMRNDWSFISAAALKIGEHVFEINHKGEYLLDGVPNVDIFDSNIAGHKISWQNTRVNDELSFEKFTIHLGNGAKLSIEKKSFFLDIAFEGANAEGFGDSVGLMGSYEGKHLGRDGLTVFDDHDLFGMEWQVQDSETIFQNAGEGPQFPNKCNMPSNPKSLDERRKLRGGDDSKFVAKANEACASWPKKMREACLYDVLATGELSMAVRAEYAN